MMPTARFGMMALRVGRGIVGGFHGPAALAQAASPSAGATPDTAAAKMAFSKSLALRADRVVADSGHNGYCWLGQTNAVAYASKEALKLKIALQTSEGEPNTVKDLGAFTLFGCNLASDPFPIPNIPV